MKSLLNRHMSLSLALRYLNPLRTYFSLISIICLMGVALGVMVLIIVLSVMGGLQKQIQEKILAFSPHLQINRVDEEGYRRPIYDWRELSEQMKKATGVQSAYALVEDFALVDVNGAQKPCSFRAIDTEDRRQLSELGSLLASGSVDMGVGEKAVISTDIAKAMGIGIGGTLRIYTTRNFNDIASAYAQLDKAPLFQRAQQEVGDLRDLATKNHPAKENGEFWSGKDIDATCQAMGALMQKGGSQSEYELVVALEENIPDSVWNEDHSKDMVLPVGTGTKMLQQLEALEKIDKTKEDLEALKSIKEMVLPKDLEVVGIYQVSKHVSSPDIFLPLEVGQELLGYDDDLVQAVALRVNDPYDMDGVIANTMSLLPVSDAEGGYQIETWSDRFSNWFTLMQQERMMMGFVLSFIALIAAFCIMAVMFTVSIQRKKELALLKALGATPFQVVRVFLWQGVLIGIIGSVLGVALALLVLHYRMYIHAFLRSIGHDPFPMDFHGVEIPAEINPYDLIEQSVKAFVMVVVASVIPALFTAYQDPAKALRSM